MIEAFESGKSMTVADDVGETHAAIESMRTASMGLDSVAIDAKPERPPGIVREEMVGEMAIPEVARHADGGLSELLASLAATGSVKRPVADSFSRPTDVSPVLAPLTPLGPPTASNGPFEPFGVPAAMPHQTLSDHVPYDVRELTGWRGDEPGRAAAAGMVQGFDRGRAGGLGALLAELMPSVSVSAVDAASGFASLDGSATRELNDSLTGAGRVAPQDAPVPSVMTSASSDAAPMAQDTQGKPFSVTDFGRENGFAAVAAEAPTVTSPVFGDASGSMAAIGGPIGAGLVGSLLQPSTSGAVLPEINAAWAAAGPPQDGRRTEAERRPGIVPHGELGQLRAQGPADAASAARALPDGAPQAPIVVHTEVHLDGSVLARAVTDRIVAGMDGPLSGTGAFDPRRSYTPIEG